MCALALFSLVAEVQNHSVSREVAPLPPFHFILGHAVLFWSAILWFEFPLPTELEVG